MLEKKFFRKNRLNIILLFISIIIFICIKKDINVSSDNRMDIITVNSMIVGFLFTGMSILISSIDKPRIKNLEENGYLDNYFNTMYISILCSIISIVGSIFLVFNIYFKMNSIFYILEKLFLISIVFFIKGMIGVIKLMQKIRKTRP